MTTNVACIEDYLKENRSTWATQSGTPATLERSDSPQGDGRNYAFTIVLDSKHVDEGLTAINAKTVRPSPSQVKALDLKRGDFHRVVDLGPGKAGINLSFSEIANLENAISPPRLRVA